MRLLLRYLLVPAVLGTPGLGCIVTHRVGLDVTPGGQAIGSNALTIR